MQLMHDDGPIKIWGEQTQDGVHLKYEMYDWYCDVYQNEGSDEVQIDGYNDLYHINQGKVDVTVAEDMLYWAKNKANLTDEECIISNNGFKVKLWTKKGVKEHVGPNFPVADFLKLIF